MEKGMCRENSDYFHIYNILSRLLKIMRLYMYPSEL